MFNPAGLALLFTAALSVAAMPSHFARHSHNHREIAARVPQPEVLPIVEVAARDMSVPGKRMLRRRGQNGRCNPNPASSSPLPSPTPAQEQDPQSSSDPAPSANTPLVKGDLNLPNTTPSQDPQQSTPTPDNDTPTPTPTPSPTPTPTPTESPTPTPSPTNDSGNNSSNNNNSGSSNSGGGQTYTGQGAQMRLYADTSLTSQCFRNVLFHRSRCLRYHQ